MSLDLFNDGLDGGIGFDLGSVQFVVEGFALSPDVIARRIAGFVGGLHGIRGRLFFRSEAGVGGKGGIMRLMQFRLLSVGQEFHVVMTTTGGRWRRATIVIGRLCEGGATKRGPKSEEKKCSFHYPKDPASRQPVS
jgi:hypothetical protein